MSNIFLKNSWKKRKYIERYPTMKLHTYIYIYFNTITIELSNKRNIPK